MYGARLSTMEPKLLGTYFEAIYRGLLSRAARRCENMTVDDLTFLEENTCDDAVAALKGSDAVREIWNAYDSP